MAPKKKNAFMIFTLDWKSKYGNKMSLQDATAAAGNIWAKMNEKERLPYKERAKEDNLQSSKSDDKLTCTGKPLSLVEKERQERESEEKEMKRYIENTVRRSVEADGLETQSYYFIMVNYFTKTLMGGVYVPAELAVCEYSILHGVKRIYQTLINPNVSIYGHQYDAQQHSERTHNLPLPPNALGEKNLGQIYNDVLNFIRHEKTNDYPPLYTDKKYVEIVDSVLEFLKADVGANNVNLKIYHLQYLLHILKEATCKVGDLKPIGLPSVTESFLDRSYFEYLTDVSCQYHEELDKSKYCTKANVTRWGYMFSNYLCGDIAIPLIPGRHIPLEAKTNVTIKKPAPTRSECTDNDSASGISMATGSSWATKPVAGSQIYYEGQKSAISDGDRNDKTYTNDFPALGATKKPAKQSIQTKGLKYEKKTKKNIEEDDNDCLETANNYWANRSRVVPRAPNDKNFAIDYKDESDCDDYNSVASYGRGRGSMINSTLNSSIAAGRGRKIIKK